MYTYLHNLDKRKGPKMKKRHIIIFLFLVFTFYTLLPLHAAINTELQPYIDSVDQVQKGGAEDKPGHKFPQHHRHPQPRKDKTQEPCAAQDQ